MGKQTRFEAGVKDMERGNYTDAIFRFTEAIENEDRVAAAFSKRGVCHIHLDERELAARDFVRAIEIDVRCLSAIVNLGNMALEDERIDDAIAKYEAALKIDPDYAMAHHNLGVAYRKQGKFAESVRELRAGARLQQKAKSIFRRFVPKSRG